MAHPLESLLRPLQYASQRNFALLGNIKALRPVLENAISQASNKVSASVLTALQSELPRIDSPIEGTRKAALLRLMEALKQEGVGAVASAPASPGSMEPVVQPTATGRARNRPRANFKAEARLLSQAPRSGPLAQPIKTIAGRLGPKLLEELKHKGIETVGDLLFLLPRSYEDRRVLKKIAELVPGERGITVGTVMQVGETRTGRRRIFRAVVADETGSVAATFFQGGPWLRSRFPVGKRLILSGELRATLSGREIPHPEVEPFDDGDLHSIHFGRIVSIYPGFERHEQRSVRQLCARAVDGYVQFVQDPLSESLRQKLSLMPLREAMRRLHQVQDAEDLDLCSQHQSPAHQRLAFDELFFLQLGMALRKQGVAAEPGIAFDISAAKQKRAEGALPFSLTAAQTKVWNQIAQDMGKGEPMLRLLQGDVGSGKTAVALLACALALQNGYQVALMAPTEILAEQLAGHAQRSLGSMGFEVGLFTGSGAAKERAAKKEALKKGTIRLAVGTHALIQDGIEFQKLGLVVIDEQHRFGVLQRHTLMSKGVRPDTLVMTATPIPRTLAMTLYGDLEVSVIDQLPPGRTPIRTRVFGERQRKTAYAQVQEELEKGHQGYVVFPLVEESEKVDLADATQGLERMRAAYPSYRVGLLHGRMSAEEKAQVMADFRAHQIDLLVCTTVVEVGVDVPNASVMVVEGAERFGLSQLHQLRGRVGRGAAASHCLLLASAGRSQESMERLLVMEKASNGFLIAEKDLELRGPGEFLGTRQSGLPELAVANLVRDMPLLEIARHEAFEIARSDPKLQQPQHVSLRKALEDRWEGRLALARVG